MYTFASTDAKILISTDSVTDAEMVKNLLHPEFDNVFMSTKPTPDVSDFDHVQPDVLVLAFNELEKSQQYYLGLYRHSQVMQQHPHRTVILCGREEVRRAYELCMKDIFDDYVLFWPMTFDASRLLMSIHNELRELSSIKANLPTSADFAAQARRLAELEIKLDQQVEQGIRHIETSSRAMEQAEQGIDMALDEFSQRLIAEAQPNPAEVNNTDALKNEISRFKQEEVHQHFHAAADSAQPLKQWAQGLKQEYAPHMDSVRALNAMAERVRPVVLVVDDDELQHKFIGNILAEENYQLIFADSGMQALGMLHKIKPDVILMDVMMPDMDGIEATRHLRGVERYAKIPVIMITGNSEGKIVVDSLEAGANDFVVKPIHRATLISKLEHALNATTP
jgi:PleD family two-component response regulator